MTVSASWSSVYVWLGATDLGKESAWQWAGTERALDYTHWRPGQPDGDTSNTQWQNCVYMRTDGRSDARWDDWHCHAARLNYVCEIVL